MAPWRPPAIVACLPRLSGRCGGTCYSSTPTASRQTSGLISAVPRPSETWDANSGELRDHWLLSKSPPGTIITRWLVALHMGTFLGLPMKILIFLSGIITTALCVTGVIIWWKKRDVSALKRNRTLERQAEAGEES